MEAEEEGGGGWGEREGGMGRKREGERNKNGRDGGGRRSICSSLPPSPPSPPPPLPSLPPPSLSPYQACFLYFLASVSACRW